MLIRFRLLSLASITIIFVLIFSLFNTVTVSADDTVPPVSTEEPVATDEPVTTQDPVSQEKPIATDEPLTTQEPISTEKLTATPEPVTTDIPAVEEEQKTVVEILQELPDDTAIVVLDQSGQPEPFVTAEVVNVIAAGDPYFWDGTQYIGYTTTACPVIVTVCNVVVSSPIQEAISAYSLTSSATGNIYIEAGTYDENVVVDGSVGYLNNLTGLIGSGSDSTTINGYISIMNMTNAFTTSGFTVTEYVVFQDGMNNAIFSDLVINSDAANTGDGLYVETTGNVTITDVLSNNNLGNGAYVDAGGNVQIEHSTFSDNGWDLTYDAYTPSLMSFSTASGINVYSAGDITLNYLIANGNANYGALLSAPSGDISIDHSQFNENGGLGEGYISNDGDSLYAEFIAGDGILIDAANDVTLSNVEAEHNASNGAFISVNGNIDIADSSFGSNGWDAEIFHCDDYCAYDFLYEYFVDGYCVDNGGFYDGTFFNPCDDFDYVSVNSPNFNFYVENGDNSGYYFMSEYSGMGLFAETSSGDIGLQDVDASFNGGDGAYLGTSNGSIFVADSYFEGNGELGYLEFDECSSADASCIFSNDPVDFAYGGSLSFSYGNGLVADATLGNITLSQVEASYNFSGGANLWTDSVDGGSILVEESDFTGNGYNPVSISGVGGMFLDSLSDEYALDGMLESPMGALYVSTAAASYSGSVDNTTYGEFDSGSGLEVEDAGGDLTLTDVFASDNSGYGAYLATSANATISDSLFAGNGYGYEGMFYVNIYDNASGTYTDGITISGSGLNIFADGNIDIDSIEASDNALHGVDLYSNGAAVITDSIFNDNGAFGASSYFQYDTQEGGYNESVYGSGMLIETTGDLSLNENAASGNRVDGATITANNISVLCGNYTENGGYGVNALQGTSFTLQDVLFSPSNTFGDYYYLGSPTIIGDDCYSAGNSEDNNLAKDAIGNAAQAVVNTLPWNVVPVDGEANRAVEFNCSDYRGTILVLPNDDRVIYPCRLKDSGSVEAKTINQIPVLPDDSLFISSLMVQLIKDNQEKRLAEPYITVSFVIPDDVNVDDLAILYWNGSKWTHLENTSDSYVDDIHYFDGVSHMTGIFALISWQD